MGAPHRFANGARLAACAGIAPIDGGSGTSINGAGCSKAGNHRLKDRPPVHRRFRRFPTRPLARAYYLRERAEGQKTNAAITRLARRRCDLILAMLKNKATYQTFQAA